MPKLSKQPVAAEGICLGKQALPQAPKQVLEFQIIGRRNVAQMTHVLREVEDLSRDKFIEQNDADKIAAHGTLAKVETVRALELLLHRGTAEIITAHTTDAAGNKELAGFSVVFWGGFCVPKHDREWGKWAKRKDGIPKDALFVPAGEADVGKGCGCVELILTRHPRHGAGSEILKRAVKQLKKHGCTFVYADIDSRNQPSQNFFERNGFHRKKKVDTDNQSVLVCADGSKAKVQWLRFCIGKKKKD